MWTCGSSAAWTTARSATPPHAFEHALHVGGPRGGVLQVVAEDLDGELALQSRDVLLDVVLDRFREVEVDAGDLREPRVHGGDQPSEVYAGRHSSVLQVTKYSRLLAVFQSVPSSGPAELTQDAPNLREGQQGVATCGTTSCAAR